MTDSPQFTNRKIVLAQRPKGMPTLDDFRLEEEPLPALEPGQVVVGTEYISIDAFIRTALEEGSYHQNVPVGGVVSGLGVGRILASEEPERKVGEAVFSPFGAQTHVIAPGAMMQPLDETIAPAKARLGVLGMTTGLTAWMGIHVVGEVKQGQTVLVSAAAGAVGSVAAQLAKIAGARVIGLAGGPDKVAFLTDDLGLDAAIDYKREDVDARLRELAPDGIDVYFDNVGGEILDIVLDQIKERARVVICGAISQYQNMGEVRGPSLYLRLAERQARMEGFAVTHFEDRFPEAEADLAGHLEAGRLKLREQVVEGIERFPEALITLFEGGNTGKMLVRV